MKCNNQHPEFTHIKCERPDGHHGKHYHTVEGEVENTKFRNKIYWK